MNILVTSIGGDIAQNVITVIRKHYPESVILGVDRKQQPFLSMFVDDFFLVPSASHSDYLNSLLYLLIEKEIDILIPTSEAEIRLLSKEIDNLKVQTIICNKRAIDVCLDKLQTSIFLKSIGPISPFTSDSPESYEGKLPLIVKPRFSSGSKGIRVCLSLAEAGQYGALISDPIYQEYLVPSENEITCGVYRSPSGEIRIIQMRRVLSGGRTVWAEVIFDQDIYEVCAEIASNLDLTGSLNIQLIMTHDGPLVFEINPRLSSTVAMRDFLGFQDLFWGIEQLLGKSLPETEPMTIGTLVGRVDHIMRFSPRTQN